MKQSKMIFPNDILLIIREFSKPLTRPDWKTAKRFTNSKLKNHLINIYSSYNFNINKILNPRFYTINDLPFKIKIGMIFYYEQNILEIINRYTFTDNNNLRDDMKAEVKTPIVTFSHPLSGGAMRVPMKFANNQPLIDEAIKEHKRKIIKIKKSKGTKADGTISNYFTPQVQFKHTKGQDDMTTPTGRFFEAFKKPDTENSFFV